MVRYAPDQGRATFGMKMRPGLDFTPLAYTSAAAVVGVGIVVIMVRATTLDSWVAPPAGSPLTTASVPKKFTGRLPAGLPADAKPRPPSWDLRVLPQSAQTESWSTETKLVAPAPQAVTRPQTARPAPAATKQTPRRTGPAKAKAKRKRITLKSRLAEIGPRATARLADKFRKANVAWPPAEIAFVAIKDEKIIQLYGRATGEAWQFVHRYPVLAASGGLGPKLRQGDRQVPEGVYRIVYLNPRSRYHVSLRVNYPNAFDRRMARTEKRTKLGGDIMIHGKKSSAGCLAIGDDAAEELFVLAAKIGYRKVKLIIAPTDFRVNERPLFRPGQPKWLPKLYDQIAKAMVEFKPPPAPSLLSFFIQ